jgi:dihydrofolate synthase/folylpolyglutamate synthase
VLAAFEHVFGEIVCTQNSTPRAMPAEELAEVARGIFGVDRVHVAPRLDDAIDKAATLAETGGVYGSGGVLVTGSVITVGEARSMLKPRQRREREES